MKKENLALVIDLILHHANARDLEFIQNALDKRKGLSAMDGPNTMAQKMAQKLSSQLGLTKDRIRGMTRDMIVQMVRQKEPGFTESQVQEAVEYFMNPPRPKAAAGAMDPRMVYSMVQDFVEFSQARMTPTRQVELRDKLGSNWAKLFFEKFPNGVKLLVKDHLEGKIGAGLFEETLLELLGI